MSLFSRHLNLRGLGLLWLIVMLYVFVLLAELDLFVGVVGFCTLQKTMQGKVEFYLKVLNSLALEMRRCKPSICEGLKKLTLLLKFRSVFMTPPQETFICIHAQLSHIASNWS